MISNLIFIYFLLSRDESSYITLYNQTEIRSGANFNNLHFDISPALSEINRVFNTDQRRSQNEIFLKLSDISILSLF